jgi:iron-sulfur cluster repair protein YtfE (RIC family)
MQEHDVLRDKVQRIHTVLAHSDPTTDEIESLLREFVSALLIHFANEEEEGFFDDVISCAPRLAYKAGELCAEHKELVRKVDELCRFASAGSPSIVWWRELNSRCHEVSRQLMRHERDENKLLQQARQVDIGTGD